MIKSENGKVEMQGNVTDLLAELSLIVASTSSGGIGDEMVSN